MIRHTGCSPWILLSTVVFPKFLQAQEAPLNNGWNARDFLMGDTCQPGQEGNSNDCK
jgi:hypothetical protein